MTLTVGKDANNPGKFSYEVHSGFNLVEFGGNYPTKESAEIAGHYGYRKLHRNGFKNEGEPFQNDYMDLDDILKELDQGC